METVDTNTTSIWLLSDSKEHDLSGVLYMQVYGFDEDGIPFGGPPLTETSKSNLLDANS